MTKSHIMFKSSDEAKSFVVELTSRKKNHDQLIESLNYFKTHRDAADNENRSFWDERVSELEAWLSSDTYKNGDYPQRIDDLMLELIEWRSAVYALQHTTTNSNPFRDYIFFQQWLIGSVYAMHSLLGKLVGNDSRENSLRNLWWKIRKFIAEDGACEKQELKIIDGRLQKVGGQFTNHQSKTILYRNTVIAHNEKNIKIGWDEIDSDIAILTRIWSIIVSWSSFGIISPFRTSEQTFSGLDLFALDNIK